MAAETHVPVLITLGSPAERERYARLIHERSREANRPFVIFHSETPLESEQTRIEIIRASRGDGLLRQRFEQARGGTLFIDDIAALIPDAQLELSSLLEERIQRHPDSSARILAGASRHLDGERASGTFSDTLFYRLNVIHLDSSA